MELVLVGKENTRRTEYFLKAAEELGVPVEFVDWDDSKLIHADSMSNKIMKLDPPSFQTANLFQLNETIETYGDKLTKLQEEGASFLNAPQGICWVLHKYLCKEQLQHKEIPVTRMLKENITSVDELHCCMEQYRMHAVFVKPIYCSGAAGVIAYRWEPKKGRGLIYTSCIMRENELINTKRLRRVENKEEIEQLLTAVISLGVVVERWYPKATYQGKSYDLRVVWQFGKMAFVVARQSSGPITNLHLNNGALPWEKLSLQEDTVEQIEKICQDAMNCFPQLHMAGIDILLDKTMLKPRIIEMNGQGDLMYQDIFQENRIYKEQIRWMAEQHRS